MTPQTLSQFSDERLRELIARFAHCRIAVIGDFFLDKYLDIDTARATRSVETGRTAHRVVGVRTSPGCAGTVVNNLTALAAGSVRAFGFVGDDGEGYDLRARLAEQGCDLTDLVVTRTRMTPTYLKPRDAAVASLEGEFDRFDTQNHTPSDSALIDDILNRLEQRLPDLDAVIIADQVEAEDCGVVTARVREALAQLAPCFPRCVFWADSRANIHRFRNVIIKPNQFEAVEHANPLPGETIPEPIALEAIQRLRARNAAPLCLTLSERGMLVSDPALTRIPPVRVPGPLDTTGAGDSATAGAILALASGATLPEAALVGCLVASITIQQLNTTGTAQPDQLPTRLALWREQQAQAPDGV